MNEYAEDMRRYMGQGARRPKGGATPEQTKMLEHGVKHGISHTPPEEIAAQPDRPEMTDAEVGKRFSDAIDEMFDWSEVGQYPAMEVFPAVGMEISEREAAMYDALDEDGRYRVLEDLSMGAPAGLQTLIEAAMSDSDAMRRESGALRDMGRD